METEYGPEADLLRRAFLEAVEANFGFLLPCHGFGRQPDDVPNWHVVTYKGQSVALEFHLDLRERWYKCKVVRLESGRIPEGYEADHGGGFFDGIGSPSPPTEGLGPRTSRSRVQGSRGTSAPGSPRTPCCSTVWDRYP